MIHKRPLETVMLIYTGSIDFDSREYFLKLVTESGKEIKEGV